MKKITDVEKEYLEFIELYTVSHGYPPSIREIAKSLYVSVTTAHRHLSTLVDKDILRFSPRTARSYTIIKEKPAS